MRAPHFTRLAAAALGASFQIGGGVRLSLLGLGAFAEIRYTDMGEDNAAVPLTVGVLF